MTMHHLLIALLSSTATTTAQNHPPWHRFATNINYRLTALLDVNGGASSNSHPDKTPGYTVPIEVLTLYDAHNDKYHQRTSYYSDTYVEYNIDGTGYYVISKPYGRNYDVDGDRICFYDEGNETDKMPYMRFFPTVGQMENYTVGGLVTDEAIPYRVATLQAAHGTHFSVPNTTAIPTDYTSGMPSNDWFELLYQESLSTGAITGSQAHAIPIKWTMLSRFQPYSAHTEHWVLRYLNYEPIDRHEEYSLWNDWLRMNYNQDCSDDRAVAMEEGRVMKLNRLGMFFSSSTGEERSGKKAAKSQFDTFLAVNNKEYSTDEEYNFRKSIHDDNVNKIEQWNREHAGRTTFVHNEFMDLEVEEVMKFRGGHIPSPDFDRAKEAAVSESHNQNQNLRQLLKEEEIDSDDNTDSNFTVYEVPDDFDPSTLPKEFDWRTHMPGSVSPIKDQGFCGSCWAFSLIASLESHWFITNSQSVNLPEQFFVDCVWSDHSYGCDGGICPVAATTLLERFGGMIPTTHAYGSYLSVDGQCYVNILEGLGMLHGQEPLLSQSQQSSSTIQLTDWVKLPKRDDVAIKHAILNQGPITVAFNVVDEVLYYANGVLDVESCTANTADDLDHAINVVGWGVDTLADGTEAEHWILRNSWSTIWGDGGYFRVRMGERDCGVSTDPGFPVVAQVDRVTAVE